MTTTTTAYSLDFIIRFTLPVPVRLKYVTTIITTPRRRSFVVVTKGHRTDNLAFFLPFR